MQLLCLVAMEPMVSFQADEIRNKKVECFTPRDRFSATQFHNPPCEANMVPVMLLEKKRLAIAKKMASRPIPKRRRLRH